MNLYSITSIVLVILAMISVNVFTSAPTEIFFIWFEFGWNDGERVGLIRTIKVFVVSPKIFPRHNLLTSNYT